jgi:hypothetical protein
MLSAHLHAQELSVSLVENCMAQLKQLKSQPA